eukprot:CAMPEP_0184472786 /NCGR_PEP_ID=MMETSP0740-20130409/115599_1 /TAXON_ID=385413 /ORGANISM="Thalassiosira miniscula, Strain CCMP1093" /LENGTH=219 /DNA_ID=CAMNT_0026849533 /DNA_START=106 /DNA_END=763 /DNA_ORIENTATION=-
MCGVCCVSMKVVVAIDLIATMILPASYCYAMYLLFLVFFRDLPVSTVLLILYGIIMGVQVVVFILRSRWDYIWWFFIYFTVGLPVFYLILPTYSFWNMDDFSWGKTRAVGGSAAANQVEVEEEDDDNDDRNARNFEQERLYDDDGTYDSRQSGYSRDSAGAGQAATVVAAVAVTKGPMTLGLTIAVVADHIVLAMNIVLGQAHVDQEDQEGQKDQIPEW